MHSLNAAHAYPFRFLEPLLIQRRQRIALKRLGHRLHPVGQLALHALSIYGIKRPQAVFPQLEKAGIM